MTICDNCIHDNVCGLEGHLDEAMTFCADVQPARQGTWEEERYDDLLHCYIATCSECGYESTDKYIISESHRYCEYCGARMLKDGDTNG